MTILLAIFQYVTLVSDSENNHDSNNDSQTQHVGATSCIIKYIYCGACHLRKQLQLITISMVFHCLTKISKSLKKLYRM